MKKVQAQSPFIYTNGINFKYKPYLAWKELGGAIVDTHYPPRFLHGVVSHLEIPRLFVNNKIARLRFVQPWNLALDTWPDLLFYEVVPFFWDVWPETIDKTISWLRKYKVKTAIFTSSQVATVIRDFFPNMNVLSVTEGIDIDTYRMGKRLVDRKIDFLSYGRDIDDVIEYNLPSSLKVVCGKEKKGKILFSFSQLLESLQNAKIVAAYPKSWTHPDKAGDIETLTQRYWECMLSGCVIIGHAPKELVNLIGYNPVIEINKDRPNEQVVEVISNIESYQFLVDKNRASALQYGDWKYSMKRVMDFLQQNGYQI